MANSFNFDVGDILLEIKQKREERIIKKKYDDMDLEELKILINNRWNKLSPEEEQVAKDIYEAREKDY